MLIFPLWCGDMPAILKGFFERILQPDLIKRQGTENAMNWRIFEKKSARIVMTMGMPVSIYRFWYGPHALKLLKRNILNFIGIKPVRETLIGHDGGIHRTRSATVAQAGRSDGAARRIALTEGSGCPLRRCAAFHFRGRSCGISRDIHQSTRRSPAR